MSQHSSNTDMIETDVLVLYLHGRIDGVFEDIQNPEVVSVFHIFRDKLNTYLC